MDGKDVKSIRLTLGLTQEEFAYELGVTHGTVSRWENGRNTPSRLAVRQIQTLAGLKAEKNLFNKD